MRIHKSYAPVTFTHRMLDDISDAAEDIEENDESIPLLHIRYTDGTETDTDIFWLRDHYPDLEDIALLNMIEIRILNKQEFETLFP